MHIRKVTAPRVVRRPDGSILSLADLPKSDTVRWVQRRKAMLVDAIELGLLTDRDAEDRYGISKAELTLWRQDRFLRQFKETYPIASRGGKAPAPKNNPLLTHQEQTVFRVLATHPNTVISRTEFFDALYPDGQETSQKILDVIICRLRQKLGFSVDTSSGPRIETIWGRGYRFVPEASET
ncbi:MAG: DUF1153 domain-containing protein [Pseudomonadota bacterium]